jgi:ATP-dependent Lhr-like helicase
MHLEVGRIEVALAALEAEGFALRGSFEAETGGSATGEGVPRSSPQPVQYCARRLLARIHGYTQDRLRKEIEPVSAQDFMRFLLRWQHAAPGSQLDGRKGVLAVVEQLQGFELAAASWEESVLPARVDGYQTRSLDALCLAGDVVWGRLSRRPADRRRDGSQPSGGPPNPSEGGPETAAAESTAQDPRRSGVAPSRATPVSFCLRSDLPWLLAAQRAGAAPAEPGPGAAREVLACLRERGALFHSDLVASLDRLPVEIEEGLWDLVARGLVTADGFQAVRSLLGARERWARTRVRRRARRGLRRGIGGSAGAGAEGRWSLFPTQGAASVSHDSDELAEAVAEQLLARWGVVFYDLLARETLQLPWREVLWAFRRMEARGLIRGGRFVSGFVGEQFALPAAVTSLRRVRRSQRSGELVRVSATDPLNLVGILTDGPRVPALRTRHVSYRDGLPVADEPAPRSVARSADPSLDPAS